MKKALSILLALVMILSLATVASAASITITPPDVAGGEEAGITYTAYKIFDATITLKGDDTIEKVSYTIKSDSIYYNTIVASGYFDLTPSAADPNVLVVTAKADYDAETDAIALAAELQKVALNGTDLVKRDDGTYKVDDLADGYYLVTSSVGSALVLDTIGDISIKTKNEYPSLEKKVEGAESTTANMGDELTFTINVEIPANAVGAIIVHDNMEGLEYVSMDSVDGITAETNAVDGCEVHFTLTEAYVSANKGTNVTITYTAKVTADVANNEAWLVDGSYTSATDDTKVYSTDIVINKVDGSDKTTPLAGAKFVLKNAEGKFYSVDANGNVTWVAAQTSATEVTTGADGKAEFANIADGTYYLVETEAPDGYNLLKDPVEVIVAAETETVEVEGVQTVQVKDVEKTIENNSGTELPSTGGVGTTMFYIFGSMMVVGAAVVLVTKKRMTAAE